MKIVRPLVFIFLGVFIALLPNLIGELSGWAQSGDANLIAILSLLTWPLGAVPVVYAIVKLLQLARKSRHVASAGETTLAASLIYAGLFFASQAWSLSSFATAAEDFIQLAFYALTATVLLILGISRALAGKGKI
ncbi:MAG: hypothetical protein RLZZ345_970 [Actinomycetota bacterium]|jgi:hypothetical protein